MIKNKDKLRFIEDFIELKKIENIYLSVAKDKEISIEEDFKSKLHKLNRMFDLIFFKFNMMDLSLVILKKEFDSKLDGQNFQDVAKIKETLRCLDELTIKLRCNINNLKLNQFEKRFILNI